MLTAETVIAYRVAKFWPPGGGEQFSVARTVIDGAELPLSVSCYKASRAHGKPGRQGGADDSIGAKRCATTDYAKNCNLLGNMAPPRKP